MQQQAHTFVERGHDEAGSVPALPARNSYSAERLQLDKNTWRMQFPVSMCFRKFVRNLLLNNQ